jgi:hypothetical protein
MAFPLEFLLHQLLSSTLMAKDKKKHSKKDDVSDDLLDMAAMSIKKFRKVTKEIGKLSTGQKIVGGLALAAAGLTYLAKQPTATAIKASAAALPQADDATDSPKPKASAARRKLGNDS